MEEVLAEPFCQLLCVQDRHPPIELRDHTPTAVGRGPLTLITDKRCSRNQVEVTADFEKQEVTLKQLGPHSCSTGGKILSKGDTYILGSGGTFELLKDQYKYRVFFGKRVPEDVLESIRNEAAVCIGSEKASTPEMDSDPLLSDKLSQVTSHTKKRTLSNDESKDEDVQSKRAKLEEEQTTIAKEKLQQKPLKHFFGAPSNNTMVLKCKDVNTMIVLDYGPTTYSAKIASFDLDGTLIETSSGKRFATGPDDWKLLPKVAQKLQNLHAEGYRILILTNQLGISRGKPTKAEFLKKVEGICKRLQVPLTVLAATARDVYRKPCTGMWDYVRGGGAVDVGSCFYVGDAAGREVNWKPRAKKDFSCSDRKFAVNVDLKFLTPEELFLGLPACKKFTWGDFDPRSLDYACLTPKLDPSDATVASKSQEVVVFTGCPASGKSSFYRQHMQPAGYAHVNRDKLGSWQKCVAQCNALLQAGKSVAVDNTNPDMQSRLRYIECARMSKVPVRCFLFLTTKEHAKHNNTFRELTVTDASYVKVNDMVFNMYKSKFSEPQLSEGFSEIVKIAFTPKFDSKEHEALYKQFLI